MNRAPGGGGEQAEILPPELERAVLLHQRVPVGGEHSQQQRRLRGGAASERRRAEPGLRQLLPPAADELDVARARGAADGQHVADLPRQQLLLHDVPLGAVLPVARVQRVEHRRVVVDGLHEPRQEGTRLAHVLLHNCHHLRGQPGDSLVNVNQSVSIDSGDSYVCEYYLLLTCILLSAPCNSQLQQTIRTNTDKMVSSSNHPNTEVAALIKFFQ